MTKRVWILATIAAALIAVNSTGVSAQKGRDRQPPTVSITGPANGSSVTGTIGISGNASDNVAVAKVEVQINAGAFALASGTGTWSYSWQTTAVSNGSHTVTARATDTAGRTSRTSIVLNVANGQTEAPPIVLITAPAPGATVSGTVALQGTAFDAVSVSKVEVSVDAGAFVLASGTATWSYSWLTTAVADGTHIVTARATDTAGLTALTSVSLNVANAPGEVGSAAGIIPTGMAHRFTVGLFEEHGGTWMRNSGTQWDARYRYFVQGWVNNWGWSPYDGSWGLSYLQDCDAKGFLPVVQYYVMNGVSNWNESAFYATVQNSAKMAEYFGQWKILMQRVKDFGKPAVILVEGDGFGFLEQQSGGNPSAYAAVAASGIPELSGLPNTVAGWGLAFLQLRKSVGANNAILAMDISGWATGKDLLYFSVTDSLQPEVDKAYTFLAPLGLSANQTGQTWDLLTNNPLDRDSDYYTTLGQNRWWDANESAPIASRSFNRYAEWLRLWNVKAGKRWVLWQIPLGNSNHLNVYNNGNPREGYKDNRPEYFFGAFGAAHRDAFVEAGVIGLYFGGGASGMSSYVNDNYTDGQLFMKSRAGWFLNGGGLPIQ
jgi:hypothetical protein